MKYVLEDVLGQDPLFDIDQKNGTIYRRTLSTYYNEGDRFKVKLWKLK